MPNFPRTLADLLLASLLLAGSIPSCATPHIQRVTVPYVPCPTDGQVGPITAPNGPPRMVALSAETARQIAYYQGGVGQGVFAPRGWQCRVSYGSAGHWILIAPDTNEAHLGRPAPLAVTVDVHDGGTSGRFGVADYLARLFPKLGASFIERVKSESIPGVELSPEPYSSDSVKYLNNLTAEFVTPPNTVGLGTDVPSEEATHGIVILDTSSDWSIIALRVRLGSTMQQLVPAIVRLNTVCMQKDD